MIKINTFAFFSILCAVLPVVSYAAEGADYSSEPTGFLRFIVIGDTGTGGDGQHQVADAIRAVCQSRGCDFALGLGDNVYEHGVKSGSDAQFESKFEIPYAELNFPFYMVIGNHDDPTAEKELAGESLSGGYEVQYTYDKGKGKGNKDGKWQMPGRYYRVDLPDAPHPLATFLAIDGAPLAGPADTQYSASQKAYRDQQGAWLDTQFAQSDARWKIVFGHFPLYSNGRHGNAGNYGGHKNQGILYKNLLTDHVCGKTDLLFAGHDHNLQWLRPVAECGNTTEIISGAGAKETALADKERNPAIWQAGDTLGFLYVVLSADTLRGTVYTVDKNDGHYEAAFGSSMHK